MTISSIVKRLQFSALHLPEPLIDSKGRAKILRKHGATIGNPRQIVTYRKCSEFDRYPGKFLLGT
jgi:hypothetical protein